MRLLSIVLVSLLVTVATRAADQDKAIAEIKKLGGNVTLDDKKPGKPVIKVSLSRRFQTFEPIGTDKKAAALPKVTDQALDHVKGFSLLQELDLGQTQVTDEGLSRLRGLDKLSVLELGGTAVTDKGLEELKSLRGLKELYLSGTKVTDKGVSQLRNLSQLKTLVLSGTQVSDKSLPDLKALKELESLHVIETKISDAGIMDLKKALPRLKVNTFSAVGASIGTTTTK